MSLISNIFLNTDLLKFIDILLIGFFFAIYTPFRILSCIYLSKKFRKYLNLPNDSLSYGQVLTASIYVAYTYSNRMRSMFPTMYKGEMPMWLRRTGLFIFLMDMLFMLYLFSNIAWEYFIPS